MARHTEQQVEIEGRRLTLTNLDKVLYPETGTTKGDVIRYYSEVAPYLLPYAAGRPVTRKRWVNGVGTDAEPGQVFFQKNLDDATPDWVPRQLQHHKDHDNVYPLVDDLATLTWLAQTATLEIHVPQWRFRPDGSPGHPDRMVFDLDPGEGVGLPECVEAAKLVRDVLGGMGLQLVPVTSGSKGIHLYAPLDGSHSSEQINELAHELARSLEADHPDLVISTMRKADRRGKVMLDWSQNNASKTTVAPYSLRGRSRPTVAMPRTWREIASGRLRQIEFGEVMAILRRRGDAAVALRPSDDGAGGEGGRRRARAEAGGGAPASPEKGDPARGDRLLRYRSMRDPAATPEPVPAEAPAPSSGRSFVIQRHQASRLHYDFRLEHDGVLVSWALPKGVPAPGERNHLAVHVEDHPLEYGGFSGDIPTGEYGAGHVDIWDHGTFEPEKWRDDEVIATLHGAPDGGLGGKPVRLALLRTAVGGDEKNWLIHRMDAERSAAPARRSHEGTAGTGAAGKARSARPRAVEGDPAAAQPARPTQRAHSAHPAHPPRYEPMLATLADEADLRAVHDAAVEMKWDGVRIVAYVTAGTTRLLSRNGVDATTAYPELADLAARLDGHDAVLDGEVIAVDRRGYPDFGLLQRRMGLTRPGDVARVAPEAPVRYMLFDLLWLDGRDVSRHPYRQRRELLEGLIAGDERVMVPPEFDGTPEQGLDRAHELHLEGVVVKERDAGYAAGRRSTDWLKLKLHRTQEVVVAGWRPGSGRRAGGVGSLLLGIPGADGLHYVGRVGTGFADAELDEIAGRLRGMARATPPLVDVPPADARDAHWVTPRLVGEVEFAEWTRSGHLRQPSWRGWRPDKAPAEVVRES